jgi:hypothetical protein
MVNLTVDTSSIPANGDTTTTLYREDLVNPLNEAVGHLNNTLNGVQRADAIYIGAASINAKAAFQVDSTTKVSLPLPKMTTAQRDAIGSVLQGSWIYNTTLNCPQSYDGAAWVSYVPVNVDEASCRLTKSASQALTTAIATIISWNQESYDTDNMHDIVTNNSRITFNTTGKYFVASCIKFTAAISSGAYAELLLNGTTVIAAQSLQAPGSDIPSITVGTIYNFTSGDYLEVRVRHNSGSNRSVDSATSHFVAGRQLD